MIVTLRWGGSKLAFSTSHCCVNPLRRCHRVGNAIFTSSEFGIPDLHIHKKKSFTVCVEGNIGCGKSTFLNHFKDTPNVLPLKEPVHHWTNLKGHNLLELLYTDSKRYAYTFNSYAILTRLRLHNMATDNTVRMLERSVHSTIQIFVKNNYVNKEVTDIENEILQEWYRYILKQKRAEVDLFVYLRVPPKLCMQRLRKRNRHEESSVPLTFLEQLHDLHDDWLLDGDNDIAPVLVLDGSHDLETMATVIDEYKSQILNTG